MQNIKNKKILWIIGAILVVLVLVLLLSQCGKDDAGNQKDTGGEIIVDEKESEDGLDIVDPEDADRESEEDAVGFVNPDGSTSGTGSDEEEDGNKTDNDQSDNDKNEDNKDSDNDNDKENDKTDNFTEKEDGNLNEESDNKTGYSDFF